LAAVRYVAHVIALRPTAAQERMFRRAAGCARLAYNWGLLQWEQSYRAGGRPTWQSVQRAFVARIDQDFPFLRMVPSGAYHQPFRHLGQAFRRFFEDVVFNRQCRPPQRKRRIRYPRVKRRHHCRVAFVVRGIRVVDGFVIVPKVGKVRICEAPRFPTRIVSATIAADADRWTISLRFDAPAAEAPAPQPAPGGIVGIDLGLHAVVTQSDGITVRHPKPLRRAGKRLRRLQRQLARRRAGSKRRARSRRAIARLHRRIRNIRREVTHTTTTAIVRRYQTIVIEDLNVRGMLRNHALAQAISDVAWGEFRRQLTYKCARHGRTLIVADRFFPSTKRCARCGDMQDSMPLSQRTFDCAQCGLSIDRDRNAALNLQQYPCIAGNSNARGEPASVTTASGLHAPARGIANPGAAQAAKSSTETPS
jgi:putative transposase